MVEPQPLPALLFFNTLSGQKEEFKPLQAGKVTMYNCGPTVYDPPHIGNLRPYIFADTLRRILELNGYLSKQVINITDVGHLTSDADDGEDKVEKRARETGKTAKEITDYCSQCFFDDLRLLNIQTAGVTFPRASAHIGEQIAFIKTLEEKGYTYKTSDGIYFDTSRFPNYGKLGKVNLKGLREGARVKENPERRQPTDFSLWKFSPPESAGQKRQQEWPSPWGIGFPGWHIECSAMSMKYLGKQLDIHTGGIDHITIHHNNEIAQSEAATNKKFVNYWLHNEFITIENRKISKSLGNTVTLKNLIGRGFSPIAYRLWLLGIHYRSPANFTWEALEGADKALFRLKKLLVEEWGTKVGKVDINYAEKFSEAISDDLNTPKALALLWDLVKDKNIVNENKRTTIFYFDKIFGLGLENRDTLAKEMKTARLAPEKWTEAIKAAVDEREKARREQNFQKADQIRQELANKGYQVKDTPAGSELHILRDANKAKKV